MKYYVLLSDIYKKFLIIAIAIFAISCSRQTQNIFVPKDKRNVTKENAIHNILDNKNVLLGLPDNLGFIIERKQYVISYSENLNVARWVSWFVDSSSYGAESRYRGNFITDPLLPSHFTIVRHADYTGSGYNRGHIVRSKERTQSAEDNITTFFLTNIIPQKEALNKGIWLQFEYYCEQLVKEQNKQLFIVSGGRYSENPQRINNKVAIPDSCWKVVLVLCNDKNINCIDTTTQIIAVMMPNDTTARSTHWQNFLTTARNIELTTGFNFFATIPPKIQNVIEKRRYYNN